MAFVSCSNDNSPDSIVVIGEAGNAKAGALVISKDDNKMYYLDRVTHWTEKVRGKTVKVTGKLLIENTPAQDPNEPIRQQFTGERRIILKPKWELIK